MNEQSPCSVIGIDVFKETLDASHLPSKEYKKVENNKKGFKEIITWAKKHNTRLVLCEATGGYQHKLVIALTKDEIRVKRIKKVEQVMEKLIKENSDWQKQKEILESVPGIGADTVRTILAELPELGTGCADSVGALVGVVPVHRDSGKMRGKRSLFGGRGSGRAALHNAAMEAVFLTKKDNVFKKMYQKMTSEGKKAPNVARIAVAHKRLKIIHALLKYGVKWENKIKPA